MAETLPKSEIAILRELVQLLVCETSLILQNDAYQLKLVWGKREVTTVVTLTAEQAAVLGNVIREAQGWEKARPPLFSPGCGSR